MENTIVNERKKLAQMLEQYLEALVEKNPGSLPVHPSCRVTFNGEESVLGENELWYNTLVISKRQSFFDAESGEMVFFGVTSNETIERSEPFIHEKTDRLHFACYAMVLRLKIEHQLITQVEELAWTGRYRYFECLPEDIALPDEAFDMAVPEEERLTREELIEIADAYWEGGFGDLKAEGMPIHPDAQRKENGYQTTNHTYSVRGDFKWNPPLVNTGGDRMIDVPRQYRQYPVADPARGIVVSMTTMVPHFGETCLRIGEAFLIREGLIKKMFAMYGQFKNKGGWNCKESE